MSACVGRWWRKGVCGGGGLGLSMPTATSFLHLLFPSVWGEAARGGTCMGAHTHPSRSVFFHALKLPPTHGDPMNGLAFQGSCPRQPAQLLHIQACGFFDGVNPSHISASSFPTAVSFPQFTKELLISVLGLLHCGVNWQWPQENRAYKTKTFWLLFYKIYRLGLSLF